MSHTARSERPISRWISCVRPEGLPSFTSRRIRSGELPGSIEYSAVTQPFPLPRIQRGTSSSIDAVHSTWVPPKVTRHEPDDIVVKSRSKLIGRSWSGWRPSGRGEVMAASSQPPGDHAEGERHALRTRQVDRLDGVELGPRRRWPSRRNVSTSPDDNQRWRAGPTRRRGPARSRRGALRTSNAVSSAESTSTTSRPITSLIVRARKG